MSDSERIDALENTVKRQGETISNLAAEIKKLQTEFDKARKEGQKIIEKFLREARNNR